MRSFALVTLLAAPVFAQGNDYATSLLSALNGLGLTSLASAIGNVSTTDSGKGLIGLLSNTSNQFTVFAPNNQGFKGAFPNATQINADPLGLANTISYHVVAGDLSNYTSKFPNTTIGRTFLSDSKLVMLEGGKSQVVAWSTYPDNATYVMNQNTPAKVVNSTVFQNLHINVIDAVLDVPGNLTNALVANNLTVLETILKSLPAASGKGTLLDYLNKEAKGFTLFAPKDSVLQAAMANATIASVLANTTNVAAVIGNHLISGSTLYSSTLASGVISAAGQPISFSSNATGGINGTAASVATSGSSSAVIATPDIILMNGVVHVIDGVFLNTESNPAAASSAMASATSVAGTAPKTTETAPIGNTATFSQVGAGASGSPSTAAGAAVALGVSKSAMSVAVMGALAGSLFVLA